MKAKNKIKQIFSIIVTAMMMMSLFTVNAFAAPQSNGFDPDKTEGIIKVLKPSSVTGDSTAKYTAYKILNATVETGTNSIYKYTVEPAFANLIGEGKSYQLTAEGKIVKADGNVVINDPVSPNAEAQQEFARAVEAYVNNTANTVPAVADATNFAINTEVTVGIGYYAVLQTATDSNFVQSLPIVVDVPHIKYDATNPNTFTYNYEISIESKIGNAPTVDKKIVENGTLVDKNDVNIGDTVTYEITSTIPKYTEGTVLDSIKYYLTDTLSDGLTYGEIVSVVAKGTDKTDLDLNVTGNLGYEFTQAGQTLTFAFNNSAKPVKSYFTTIKDYDKIVIKYTAKLNEKAVIASDNTNEGNPNIVNLTYTNNPSTGSTSTTENKKVTTYTYKIDVVKTDSVSNVKLAGAVFELEKKNASDGYDKVTTVYVLKDGAATLADGTTVKVETDANGSLVLLGLDAGDYRLREVKAPEGYVLPTGDNACTNFKIAAVSELNGNYNVNDVSGNNSSLANNIITIKNVKGVNLPQTGGAGTWMFTIGGLVLMAGAVVVFMATRKKKAN